MSDEIFVCPATREDEGSPTPMPRNQFLMSVDRTTDVAEERDVAVVLDRERSPLRHRGRWRRQPRTGVRGGRTERPDPKRRVRTDGCGRLFDLDGGDR